MTSDTSHSNASAVLEAYFAAKNRRALDDTMAYFSHDLVTYTDSTLGWTLDSYDQVRDIFAQYMPNWANGASLPIRILAGARSAVVEFVDTPELFGGELHLLGAVDLEGDRIVRWVDFWDTTSFDPDLYAKIAVPQEAFPPELTPVDERADPEAADISRRLHAALAAVDGSALQALFSRSIVFEDMASRTRIVGREACLTQLAGVLPNAPYGSGSGFSRAVGGGAGGGYEWRGSLEGGVRYGLTAFELTDGAVTRLTIAYDGGRLPDAARDTARPVGQALAGT